MHHNQFDGILRKAAVARVVSPIVRKHDFDLNNAASAPEKCEVARQDDVALIAAGL